MTQGWISSPAYHAGLRSETGKVCHAFLNKIPVQGKNCSSEKLLDEWALVLHHHPIVARVPAGRNPSQPLEHFAFCMHGFPTNVTLDRLNGVCLLHWGQKLFCKRKGRVYFGPAPLREVEPYEVLRIPLTLEVKDHANAA